MIAPLPQYWSANIQRSFWRNLWLLLHSLGIAHLIKTYFQVAQITHTGCPLGCVAYGSVWLLLTGYWSLCERVATNQWLRSPSQGSKRIAWRVRGLFLVLMMDIDAPQHSATLTPLHPQHCSRWGDDGRSSERRKRDGLEAGCSPDERMNWLMKKWRKTTQPQD